VLDELLKDYRGPDDLTGEEWNSSCVSVRK
jgi:hypothetical protein